MVDGLVEVRRQQHVGRHGLLGHWPVRRTWYSFYVGISESWWCRHADAVIGFELIAERKRCILVDHQITLNLVSMREGSITCRGSSNDATDKRVSVNVDYWLK
jgi:hypothetical protein